MITIERLSSKNLHLCLMLCVLITLPAYSFAAPLPSSVNNVALPGGAEIPVTVFHGNSDTILLWLPSENGLVPAEFNAAGALAKLGMEVWLADLHTAYFLPVVPSSMKQIPADDIAQLISAIIRLAGKKVCLITEGSGAALALTAAADWHGNAHDLRGAILLSPNFYVATPEPGEDAQYLPIASTNRLPIAILQPELSPWRWHIDQLQSLLQQSGATVTVKLLPGVRDRFYFRDDALAAEQAFTPTLPKLILNTYNQLRGVHP